MGRPAADGRAWWTGAARGAAPVFLEKRQVRKTDPSGYIQLETFLARKINFTSEVEQLSRERPATRTVSSICKRTGASMNEERSRQTVFKIGGAILTAWIAIAAQACHFLHWL